MGDKKTNEMDSGIIDIFLIGSGDFKGSFDPNKHLIMPTNGQISGPKHCFSPNTNLSASKIIPKGVSDAFSNMVCAVHNSMNGLVERENPDEKISYDYLNPSESEAKDLAVYEGFYGFTSPKTTNELAQQAGQLTLLANPELLGNKDQGPQKFEYGFSDNFVPEQIKNGLG